MNAESREAHWNEVYRTKADDEVSWFQSSPVTSLALIAKAGLGPEAGIIDIGGGASRLVDHLVDRGYRDVSVLDISGSALDVARARLGGRALSVNWIVADVTTWTPPRTYDLWHDRAAFHFLTEAGQRDAYVRTLRQALRPGGFAIIATFAIDGPQMCSGLPIVRYDAASLAAVLGPAFEFVAGTREEHRTPAERIQKFQFSLFRRL